MISGIIESNQKFKLTDKQRRLLELSELRCDEDNITEKQKRILIAVEEMILHLEEKYGREFMVDNYVEANKMYGTGEELYVSEVGSTRNDNWFYMYRDVNEDGSYQYEDEYYGLLIRDDFEAFLSTIVNKYRSEFKVISNIKQIYPEHFDKDFPLEEALKTDEISGDISIFIRYSDKLSDDELNSLLNDLATLKQDQIISIVYLKEGEDIRSITQNNYERYLARRDTKGTVAYKLMITYTTTTLGEIEFNGKEYKE